jgi:hypothetical protein
MDNPLESVAEADLLAEIARRRAIRDEQEKVKRLAQQQLWLSSVDFLLTLVPNHNQTSCSDKDVSNGDNLRCSRCILLVAKRYAMWDEQASVEITINRVPLE